MSKNELDRTLLWMREHLDRWFVGQDKFKDLLSLIGHKYGMSNWNHYNNEDGVNIDLPKVNTLVIGGTGSGKTYCISEFAKFMGLPFIRIDCSTITGSGWNGTSLTDYLKGADPFTIVFLDEFDKLSIREDNNSKGFVPQFDLLDILEGKIIKDEKGNNIDTSNFLIFLGGSFEELKRFDNKKSIGFSDQKESPRKERDWKEFMYENNIARELLGRIDYIYEMKELTDDELIRAITDKEIGVYKYYVNLFSLYGKEFILPDYIVMNIVKRVRNSKYGLREINRGISEYADIFLRNYCSKVCIDFGIKKRHDKYIKRVYAYELKGATP